MCSCVVSEARLFFCTGTPVQPHDSQNLEGLGVEVRWMMIPPGVWASINLPTALKSYTAFVGHFGLEEESQGGDQDPPRVYQSSSLARPGAATSCRMASRCRSGCSGSPVPTNHSGASYVAIISYVKHACVGRCIQNFVVHSPFGICDDTCVYAYD